MRRGTKKRGERREVAGLPASAVFLFPWQPTCLTSRRCPLFLSPARGGGRGSKGREQRRVTARQSFCNASRLPGVLAASLFLTSRCYSLSLRGGCTSAQRLRASPFWRRWLSSSRRSSPGPFRTLLPVFLFGCCVVPEAGRSYSHLSVSVASTFEDAQGGSNGGKPPDKASAVSGGCQESCCSLSARPPSLGLALIQE